MSTERKDFPFEFRNKPVSERKRMENWKSIQSSIENTYERESGKRILRIGVMVAVLLIVAVGSWYFFNNTQSAETTLVSTDYGEKKTIVLPDGSIVTLNAKSSLKVPEDWSSTDDRQVWLEGEAYFEVEKKPATKQKFVVHTKDMDVEVLGTKFNVNTRRRFSVVSLEEGKIQLAFKGEVKKVLSKKALPEKIELKPGDVATVDTALQLKLVKEREVVHRSGWSRDEFHFNNTALSEVAKIIEETYGYSVSFEDPALMEKKVSGDLRVNNINELIRILEFTLKVKMTITDKTIKVSQP